MIMTRLPAGPRSRLPLPPIRPARSALLLVAFALSLLAAPPAPRVAAGEPSGADRAFGALVRRYIDEFPALSPVGATSLGDHRFDGRLDEVSPEARARRAAFVRRYLGELRAIPRDRLSRDAAVDAALLEHDLRSDLWHLERFRAWAWDPLRYTALAGNAVYSLLAREFAPLPERLGHVADRLAQLPRLLRQVRGTLDPERVPRIHAETAVRQNRGVLSIIDHMVVPHLGKLDAALRERLERAIEVARREIDAHQKWLEDVLLPRAAGDFRIGRELYDERLAFTLNSGLTRGDVRRRADIELRRVREEMWQIARGVYAETHEFTTFPEKPTEAYKQAIIRAALEQAYRETPEAERILEAARASLARATAFVRERDLVTVPPDPVEIIVMPEFRRGVSLAYCDSPGPLDVGQKTFYAVAPPPSDWTAEQLRSFLREYNSRSIHDLTIHEAMPGHFLQLAHSNRYPSTLRAVLSSGVFIEGWAVYSEQMMVEQGFLDGDPLMRLIARKWLLRGIGNAIIDQAIHVDGMTRDEAMRLMVEDTFQEEREAAAKWVRAQLTSTQLATYFVGYLEHVDLRREVERAWGDRFDLKTYHDRLLSRGSPPVRYVREHLLASPPPGS